MMTAESRTRRTVSSVVVLLLTMTFLVTAYQYSAKGAAFPLIVGWVTLVLCALDLIACTRTAAGERLTAFLHRPRSGGEEDRVSLRREAAGIAWIGAAVGLIALVGFLAALPVYIFAFMKVCGRNSAARSALIACLTTVVIYAVFEWLLRYELYRGAFSG